jgi:Ca2+-binding RTX toxin-like protein
MATIFLQTDDVFTLAATNTDDTVFGSNGSETVILDGNPEGTRLDGNIETVQVAGNAADSTLQINGQGQLELVSGGVAVATFAGGLNQSVDLQFEDGNVKLTQTSAKSFTVANPDDDEDVATIDLETSQKGDAVTRGDDRSTAGEGGAEDGGAEDGGAEDGGADAPTFTLSESTNFADEGETVTYTVTANGAVNEETSLTVSVAGSDLNGAATAATAEDFEVSDTSVTFEEGAEDGATKTFTVTAKSDTVAEGLEGVKVSLLDDDFNTVASETTAITNVDPEPETFTLTVADVSITEGNDGTKNMVFTAELDSAPSEATTINFQTLDTGTASAGDDFDVAGGSITFAEGQTTATATVTVNNDTDFEADETVEVKFSGDSLTGDVTATGTIKNDDVDPDTVPQTIALTTNVDTGADFVAAGAGDTFRAVVGTDGTTANGTTLQAGDDLDGGDGSDELAISITGDHAGAVTRDTFTLNSIERVSVSNSEQSGNNDTISLGLAEGVETVALSSSSASGNTIFSNVQNVVDAEMSNGAGDLTVNYAAAAVAGTNDEMTLTVSGVTAGTFTVDDGIETFSIVSSGNADNTLTGVDSGDVETLTISGSAGLTITDDIDAQVATVDASTATGDIDVEEDSTNAVTLTGGAGDDTLEFDGTTTDDSVAGGAGDDRIIFDGGEFDNADTVDGGDGTDTLVAESADLTGYTIADPATLSNIEVLEVSDDLGADLTVADVQAGIDTVTIAQDFGNAARTIQFEAGTKTVNLQAAIDGALTVADTGDAENDVLSLVNDQDGNVDVFADQDLLINGFETVTIDGNADGDTAQDLENVTLTPDGDGTATLNLIGSDQFNATNTITAGAIDASGLTGDAVLNMTAAAAGVETITGSANGDTLLGDASSSIDGGAGDDDITGGANDDTLIGGAGDDQITADSGDDSIEGGAGDDTFELAGNLTSADTIDGGDGDDTLNVTDLSGGATAGVTNVETLAVTGAATVSLSSNLSGFETINLANDAGSQDLTFADGYTAATTVELGGTNANVDSVTNTANISLTVDATDDDIIGNGESTLTGGTDTDTLLVTADNGTIDTTGGGVTNFDVITVRDGDDGDDITLNLNGYATALTVDASTFEDGEVLTISNQATAELTVTGGAGDDDVTGGTANDTIVLGAGDDTYSDLDGNDNVTLGAGDDTIDVGDAELTYQDTIDGGDGGDTIELDATTAVADIAFQSVSNVETITITDANAGLTIGNLAAAAGIVNVNALSGVNNTISAAGYTTGVTITAATNAGNNDDLTGGQGNDTYVFSGANGLEDGDVIDGTAGSDVIQLDNSGGAVTAVVDMDDIDNVLSIQTTDDDGGDDTTAEAIDVTFSAIAETTEQTVTVDASSITDDDDDLDVTNSAASTTTAFSITGGAGDDTLAGSNAADTLGGGSGADSLTGNGGADTLLGGAGDDAITGGDGADSQTGGAGTDTFVFASTTNIDTSDNAGATTQSTSTAADTISDFTAGTDNVQVELALANGGETIDVTDQGDAASIADGLALLSSANGEYFFVTGSNQLVMDLDGNGLIQANDLVVNLTDETGFDSSDMNVSVTGGTGADDITTGAGDDTIEGGGDNDVLDGGAGSDTFVYEGDGSDGEDTINNFATGANGDVIDITNSEVVDNGGNVDVGGFALLAGGAATVNDGLVVIDNNDGTNNDAGSLAVGDVATYLGDVDGGGNAIVADDADDHFYIVVSDGTDSALFEYVGDGGDTDIEGTDLDLIATFDGIGDAGTLTAANFADFA